MKGDRVRCYVYAVAAVLLCDGVAISVDSRIKRWVNGGKGEDCTVMVAVVCFSRTPFFSFCHICCLRNKVNGTTVSPERLESE